MHTMHTGFKFYVVIHEKFMEIGAHAAQITVRKLCFTE